MPNFQNVCFECGGEFVPQVVDLVGERGGKEYTVRVLGVKCAQCGFATIDNDQSGEFTKAVSDAYRADHGFLTGAEIKERRHRLGMTQPEFAVYLGNVGVASVKRWEHGQVQERAMDELIRLKTDPELWSR